MKHPRRWILRSTRDEPFPELEIEEDEGSGAGRDGRESLTLAVVRFPVYGDERRLDEPEFDPEHSLRKWLVLIPFPNHSRRLLKYTMTSESLRYHVLAQLIRNQFWPGAAVWLNSEK